jgi:L-seryl-tRNA(Ser) seleniumtransferase
VRLDKMTLAALEATLRLYLDEERALREIPTLRMLAMTPEEAARLAEGLAAVIRAACGDAYDVAVQPDISRAGGGALPMEDIATTVVALAPARGSAKALEAALRLGEPAVIARIKDDRLLLDPRTLQENEAAEIVAALAAIAKA